MVHYFTDASCDICGNEKPDADLRIFQIGIRDRDKEENAVTWGGFIVWCETCRGSNRYLPEVRSIMLGEYADELIEADNNT